MVQPILIWETRHEMQKMAQGRLWDIKSLFILASSIWCGIYLAQENGDLGTHLTTGMTHSGHAREPQLLHTALPVHGHITVWLIIR